MAPVTAIAGATSAPGANSNHASSRNSPAVGSSGATGASLKPKPKINSNGYHPPNPQTILSSLNSPALDLSSVERRGQPTAVREPVKNKTRPHGIEEAPTYRPTEEEWQDPVEYIKSIAPTASQYGICKIIPPDSWNPDFAIDTEKFHFRTRKQELNSVEGRSRANLTYQDGLFKFHKQQGNNLHRLPYVDKKPLDLYRLKKAVESRGGFDKVCKGKKWAEIGRDLGYSGKIMSSLSTSLKNSYQRWLCPYEDYLRLAKPGVHQQLEAEYGGPLTPSPAGTPMKRSNVNTPLSMSTNSPARQASDALQTNVNGIKKESDQDSPMPDAGSTTPAPSGFTSVNARAFTPLNSGFSSINRPANTSATTPNTDGKKLDSPLTSTKNTPEPSHSSTSALKRQLSNESSCDAVMKEKENGTDNIANDLSNRRSKRLKKGPVPTVAGSHMSQFRPSVPRIPRDETNGQSEEKCTNCGKNDSNDPLLVCESCDNAYHGHCLDPPLKRNPETEWNCPRCLVGDGQFGFEEGGLYSLKQFQQKANDFKQGYFEKKMPFDRALNCHRPVTEEDVETEFWRLVSDLEETVEVEYGADIHCTTHGSGFPTLEKHPNNAYASDPWNLNVLPFHPDSLFRHIKSDISGMTVPWVYVGMIFSTFCWHNEDHYAYSANYQHLGATKTWYGIPGADSEKFEEAMKDAVPELFETQPDLLFQLVTLLTPEQLKKADVRVYAVDQRAGQFVITFPQAYHAGFNHGFNFNEAVNFAPSDWEPYGLDGVNRLQLFRRQPCFSHDELLWTAAEGSAASGLTIQSARWLEPALRRLQKRELAQRKDFITKHTNIADHRCKLRGGDDPCPLTFNVIDEDVVDEDEQCCYYCKSFAYLSRFKCLRTGKVCCILHAGYQSCCDLGQEKRFLGEEHALIYHKTDKSIDDMYSKVEEKARTPEVWEGKYEKLLDDETYPSLKAMRALLHEGERIPYELASLQDLRRYVERCNAWVDQATHYIVRKQQNRRKNERVWQTGARRSIGSATDQKEKEKENRNVSNIRRLLEEAEHIGFECPEIAQLQERAAAVTEFQKSAADAIENSRSISVEAIEELLDEGRSFNVDMKELDALARDLEQRRWNQKAQSSRRVSLSLKEVEELISEAKRLEIPAYNDHFTYYREQLHAGEAWEKKAHELIHAEFVHYPQLEALFAQVQANALPVSQDTLTSIDTILHKQREAHRQIIDLTTRSHHHSIRERPKYAEVVELSKKLEELNSKPKGTIDLENERKRHEDWMRKGKKLFGKSNAPLHILKSHLEYVLERNQDCFDTVRDKPGHPGEPVSREASPEENAEGGEDKPSRQVFCICRKVEAGMMIECELCHEWYHYKCLKIARGKVKDDDKYTCPICDWRVKIPRDASRPKLEDLVMLVEDIQTLPFQPEEEEPLRAIIDNAQSFRDHIARYCNPIFSTEAEVDTQRFFLRKIEGAEVLLAYETNFFRQELHKWCQVAPAAPPILEVSLSTRKPRPTKLQKMLAEYGVDNPDDLPEHAKGKANSLRRKAMNAEAAAAAQASGGSILPPSSHGASGVQPLFSRNSQAGSSSTHDDQGRRYSVSGEASLNGDAMDVDTGLHPSFLGAGGPQLHVDNSSRSLEDRLLQGDVDDIELHSEEVKSKALEILGRTEQGRQQAEKIWGADVWGSVHRPLSNEPQSITAVDIDPMMKHDDGNVDQMFKEMTNQDDEDDSKKKDAGNDESGKAEEEITAGIKSGESEGAGKH